MKIKLLYENTRREDKQILQFVCLPAAKISVQDLQVREAIVDASEVPKKFFSHPENYVFRDGKIVTSY